MPTPNLRFLKSADAFPGYQKNNPDNEVVIFDYTVVADDMTIGYLHQNQDGGWRVWFVEYRGCELPPMTDDEAKGEYAKIWANPGERIEREKKRVE